MRSSALFQLVYDLGEVPSGFASHISPRDRAEPSVFAFFTLG